MNGLNDSEQKLVRKDNEAQLADKIIVASSFTKKSLEDYFDDPSNIAVVPYGFPESIVSKPIERRKESKLKLFFAGHLTQQKGIADLIDALKMLAIDWQITLAGRLPDDPPPELLDFLRSDRCTWLGVVPHQTLLEEMRSNHVFVFPSLFEGFGLVISEALASGLPVITTENTCGVDIIQDGYSGFLVPIRSAEVIAERITKLAEDEVLRQQMAFRGLSTAKARTWLKYSEDNFNVVSELLHLAQ